MRILLFGLSQVSALALEELIRHGSAVVGVVLRSRCAAERALRSVSEAAQIPCLSQASLAEASFLAEIRSLEPDLLFSIAFDRIIPPSVLGTARIGAFNWHPSLLPKYRGRDPYFWVLTNGERETGLTVHEMVQQVDAGPILYQRMVPIDPSDTWGTLANRLDRTVIETLPEVLSILQRPSDQIPRIAQDEAEASRAPAPTHEDLRIDWNRPSLALRNLIRAANPTYGARASFRGRTLALFGAEPDLSPQGSPVAPGTVLAINDRGISVKTGDGALILGVVQLEDCYLLAAREFALREGLRAGDRLQD